MGFEKRTTQGDFRRVLLVGPPNSRKTTSLLTFPRPIHIMSYPGEKGYETIPTNLDGAHSYIWTTPEVGKPESATSTVSTVRKETVKIISGGYGPINTFAGDGLHKLYGTILDSVTDGAFSKGEEFEPKLYGRAAQWFLDYLDLVMHSKVPYVVFTVWPEHEKDRKKSPGEKDSDVPSHIYPDLPGRMAKRIMGEFNVVVYCTLKRPKPGEPEAAVWQTRPSGEVWGCQIKGPEPIVSRIPLYVPAEWPVLEQYLSATHTTPPAQA